MATEWRWGRPSGRFLSLCVRTCTLLVAAFRADLVLLGVCQPDEVLSVRCLSPCFMLLFRGVLTLLLLLLQMWLARLALGATPSELAV